MCKHGLLGELGITLKSMEVSSLLFYEVNACVPFISVCVTGLANFICNGKALFDHNIGALYFPLRLIPKIAILNVLAIASADAEMVKR